MGRFERERCGNIKVANKIAWFTKYNSADYDFGE